MTLTTGQSARLGIRRRFTTPGVDPYDMVNWERRDARIANYRDGSVVFEQLGVEFPTGWSQNATNIVVQKYFRGHIGSPERETSLRQVIDRIVDTYTAWGDEHGYFADEDERETFRAELKYLKVHQMVAFNSPVWFNVGVANTPQQVSACFILAVEDTMRSILNWYTEEGCIFQGGSGAGINLSNLRSSYEKLKGGGTASGPVSFMRGADASAGTIKSGGKTRRAAKMVILNADHPDIESFIWCKAIEERKARVLRDAGFDMDLDGKDSHSTQYQNANNSVRVTDEFMQAVVDDADWHLRAVKTGEPLRTIKARNLFRQMMEATWECADPGMQFDSTINRWHTLPEVGPINGSNPCSEYMSIDNSSCNLASLNLMKFIDEDGRFDVDGFRHAASVTFTAMDISICRADFPTEKITDNTRKYRQLGLGYANLGAMLMALGLPYDSDDGRAVAAIVTSLMCGEAYATSGRLAARVGPFFEYATHQGSMTKVLGMHRDESAKIKVGALPDRLRGMWQAAFDAGLSAWDEAIVLGSTTGIRNSQGTLLAPTGTIGLAMDCDTTGIEPDLGLCKTKKLVGGGTMEIVNQTVPRALKNLGYTESQIEAIKAYIDEHKTILGAPHVHVDHLPVFACSMGDNAIEPMGHVRMMAAVQPLLSGAISKTCNVPETATVEDMERIHIDAWRLGLKSLAVYRDMCKVGQPLSASKKDEAPVVQPILVKTPVREKLPRMRSSKTFSFRVADCHGYCTVGEYDDGRPGEIFLRVAKQGSTLAGIMDAFAISVSHGLQYGVPLKAFVQIYSNMRFEPAGVTDDAEIRFASSLVDYIFRRLAVEYLPAAERAELGILTIEERMQPTLPGVEEETTVSSTGSEVVPDPVLVSAGAISAIAAGAISSPQGASDAPMCFIDGSIMVRAGSCYCCPSCGNTSGCS